jgi:hypothetical protein
MTKAAASNGAGWIGSWSPGIGDPTFAGWLTVALYAVAAWQCYRATRPSSVLPRSERMLWLTVALGLLALGINKQLDLQSAFTEIGRIAAHQQGWYERRHEVQRQFTIAVAAAAAASVLLLAGFARRAPLPTMLALVGSILLLAFVVIRAASFHHVDLLLADAVFGLKLNWVLEIGGILIILLGACWRMRRPES